MTNTSFETAIPIRLGEEITAEYFVDGNQVIFSRYYILENVKDRKLKALVTAATNYVTNYYITLYDYETLTIIGLIHGNYAKTLDVDKCYVQFRSVARPNPPLTASMKIEEVLLDDLEHYHTELNLPIGESIRLEYLKVPNANDLRVRIMSTDPDVATIAFSPSSNNILIGNTLSVGTTRIILSSPSGHLTSSLVINVIPKYPLKGEGTINNPYLIGTPDELQAIIHYKRGNNYFRQVNDIDMTGYNFISIGSGNNNDFDNYFNGHYDGGNFKISNLTQVIDQNNLRGEYKGLFGNAYESTFKDVNIVNINLSGESNYIINGAGALVGEGLEVIVTNCHVSGTFTVFYDFVGGLIGYLDYYSIDSTIERCSSSVNVTNVDSYAGGLIGYISGDEQQIVRNCFATGQVSSSYAAGGLIGTADYTLIQNCYATGEILEGSDTGGIIGDDYGDVVYDSVYYDSETTGQTATGRGEPKTTEQMKKQATFENWDFENVWSIRENKRYPYFATKSKGQLESMPLTIITVVS